jgi:phosphoserine phosphatase RsbU/P
VPSGILGALTSLVFLITFILRFLILKRIVHKSPLIDQSKKQFFWEYALLLFTGFLIVLLDYFILSIPLTSGIVFFIGFAAFGFFIAVDMSLQKERKAIEKAIESSKVAELPLQFYPLTRKFFIGSLVTSLVVTVIIMLIIGRDLAWLSEVDHANMKEMMKMMTQIIFKEISLVVTILLILVINTLYSYSKNLKMLFQTETDILESVSNGDLSTLVPVATSDEFGVIAGYTNKMIHGLRDRIKILTRLNVAREVQENLLPSNAPDFHNLDISGKNLYCEEVGGDYFDYFRLSENKIGIAVTDSAGHGVGAALHMTTIRAFFRYGVDICKGPHSLISSVNKYITKDSFETGRFTTVFYVEIDNEEKIIKWIRAGHEPALLFTPGTGKCEKLVGKGMALGVQANTPIEENEIRGWEKNSILVIYSDGLKESRNPKGEMYGEERILKIIKQNATQSAKAIEQKIINDLNDFRGSIPIEDDITMVIVKFI